MTKREIKKQVTRDLSFTKDKLVNKLDTPAQDAALIQYLRDTIAWLDEMDKEDVNV